MQRSMNKVNPARISPIERISTISSKHLFCFQEVYFLTNFIQDNSLLSSSFDL